jgi:hypothetical protein
MEGVGGSSLLTPAEARAAKIKARLLDKQMAAAADSKASLGQSGTAKNLFPALSRTRSSGWNKAHKVVEVEHHDNAVATALNTVRTLVKVATP